MSQNNKRRRRTDASKAGARYNASAKQPCITVRVEPFYQCDAEGRVVGEVQHVLSVSVPIVVRHHRARTGGKQLRVGQVCAGSLDLALNILNYLYPPSSDDEEPVRCRGVNLASATAYRLHQPFCAEFLAPMDPQGGGQIPVARIRSWVRRHSGTPHS